MDDKISENSPFSSLKIKGYLLLAFIFIITSYLSLKFVQSTVGDKTSMISFTHVSYEIYIQLFILSLLFFLFDGLRFFMVLKVLKIKINFWYLLKVVFINIFVSNITPYAVGGSVYQIFYLHKKEISVGSATAATTIKNVLPVIFFFVTTPIILLTDNTIKKFLPHSDSRTYIMIVILIYLIISYFFFKLIFKSKLIKKALYKFLFFLYKKKLISFEKLKKIRNTVFKEIDTFVANLKKYLNGSVIDIFLSVLFTGLYLLSMFYFSVVLVSGLGYEVSTIKILNLQDIIVFLTYFAPTPGSTGIAEGINSFVFSDFIKNQDLVSLTFAWRFFTLYVGMIVGLVLFYMELIKNKLVNKK